MSTYRFRMILDLDNEAFENDNRGRELARVLRSIADSIELDDVPYGYYQNALDINGNTIGRFRIATENDKGERTYEEMRR